MRVCWAVAAAMLIFAGVAGAAQGTSSMAGDLAHRDKTIHWPAGGNPGTATQFSHNEALIDAGCAKVWGVLTDVTKWPEWFVLVKDVSVEGGGGIRQGSLIRMTIFGSPIVTRIDEFVPDERLGWTPGIGETTHVHYHAWHLTPAKGGCRVVTEETGTGPADRVNTAQGSRMMHQAHDLWLASLKWRVEE